jgi:hypothetical protein
MVDADVVAFQGAFNLLATTFRLYGTKSDKELVCDSYFKALRRFPLAVVVKAAEDLVAKHPARSFPLAADWIALMPRHAATRVPEGVRVLSDAELSERRDAFTNKCIGAPCDCRVCRRADVSDRGIAFVPIEDAPLVWDPVAHGLVVPGRWIHGDALARWWAARDRFFAALPNDKTRQALVDDDPLGVLHGA